MGPVHVVLDPPVRNDHAGFEQGAISTSLLNALSSAPVNSMVSCVASSVSRLFWVAIDVLPELIIRLQARVAGAARARVPQVWARGLWVQRRPFRSTGR